MNEAFRTSSTRPYLIRALHEWCGDNGLTPYVAVRVDESVQVPREFVKNGEIVLNISSDATSALQIDNEFIAFKARFAGVAREVIVPVNRVMAIYAKENGQGMAFPLEAAPDEGAPEVLAAFAPQEAQAAPPKPGLQLASSEEAGGDEPPPERPKSGGARPALKRVK